MMTGPADVVDSENADTIRMLIATDNHLGYMEKDPIRSKDSIDTFAEILQIAQERKVDFILLGGDLFHDNKPSRSTLYQTMQLLRQYCMGDKPCEFDFLSDQSVNFDAGPFSTVNYQDPNLNVAIPVFSIHGNHDDPSGEENLAALDLLSIAGLVNYFGKSKTADEITIQPLLMQKGATKLAVFGLGNVRDERLYRTIVRGKLQFMRPTMYIEDWFNVFVIHQNRVRHTATSHIPESFIDRFLHFIIWGHEHECVPETQMNNEQAFEVVQPGSSVATSLSEGEAKPKHVGILNVNGHEYHWEPIRLKTVRPFIMDEIVLKETGLRANAAEIEEEILAALTEKVDEMITQAADLWKEQHGSEKEVPATPLPLIRLKVEYSGGFPTYPPQRFGTRYVNKVANPKDILQFYKKKSTYDPNRERRKAAAATTVDNVPDLPAAVDETRVEDLVYEYLRGQTLEILPENELGDAIKEFVEKDDKDAIKDFVIDSLKKIQLDVKNREQLEDEDEDDDDMAERIRESKEKLVEEYKEKGGAKRAPKTKAAGKKKKNASSMDEEEDEEEEESEASTKKTKGKGKAAPKKAAAKPAPKKAAAASSSKSKKKMVIDSDEDEEEEQEDEESGKDVDMMSEDEEPKPKPKASSSSTRKKAAPAPAAPEPRAGNKRVLPGTITGGSQPKKRATAASQADKKQTTLSFGGKSQASQVVELSD